MAKKRLTIEEQIELRTLYETGAFSQRKLAKQFGCSLGTVNEIVNRKKKDLKIVQNPELPEREPPLLPPTLGYIESPIDFRISILSNMMLDVQNLSSRGSNPASLYRTILDVHDQITEMKRAAGEFNQDISKDEMLMIIEQAFIQFAPSLRDEMMGRLVEIYGGNIVALQGEG